MRTPKPPPAPIDYKAIWRKSQRMIQQAIANGTHGPTPVVCQGCYEWVKCFFHKTLDGKMICHQCWLDQGSPK